MSGETYPPISDYAYIGDCHSAAPISRAGSIDWCCMPRLDSGSCFGRLLGWQQGGYGQIAPSVPCRTSRRYVDNVLIVEATFHTDRGKARLFDCFTMRQGGEHAPHWQILRILEGITGEVPVFVDIVPRFDYGSIKPWIQRIRDDRYMALGGSDGLLISGDAPIAMKHRHDLGGGCTIKAGQRLYLSILWRRPEDLADGRAQGRQDVDQCRDRLWEQAGRCVVPAQFGPRTDACAFSAAVHRSACETVPE